MSSNQREICVYKQICWILFSCSPSSQLQTCLGVIDRFCCNFIWSASQKLVLGTCYSRSIQWDNLFTAEGKSHRECWRKIRSQRFERAWWELGNTAAARTGSPPSSLQDHCDRSGRAHRAKRVTSGSTKVVERAGGAEQLGKLNTIQGFFSFLLCSDEKQSPNAKFFLKVTSCTWLLAEQSKCWDWGKHSLGAVGYYCHWEFLVSHLLHLKLCCQRILLKLWVFFTCVSFFPSFWSRRTSQKGAKMEGIESIGYAVIWGKLTETGEFSLVFLWFFFSIMWI